MYPQAANHVLETAKINDDKVNEQMQRKRLGKTDLSSMKKQNRLDVTYLL